MKKKVLVLLLIFSAFASYSQKSEHYRDFDFWIGSWKVYKSGTDSLIGYSKISSVLSGYAIRENFESATSNYKRTSLSKFNPETNKWEHFGVDNNGLTLYLNGAIIEGEMNLQSNLVDSIQAINKITWTKQPDGNIRQVWQISKDMGLTWGEIFDGDYRKRDY